MIITIEANSIEDLLAQDECLIPAVEDLLLDAIIEYRYTPKPRYTPSTQIAHDPNVKITISSTTATIMRNGGNNGTHDTN